MSPVPVTAIPVFLTAIIYVAGTMLLGTSLPLKLVDSGVSTTVIGLIMVPYSFGFMLGSLIGPQMIRNVGHIRVYSAFAAIFCVLALTHGAVVDEWLWALLRTLSGLCGCLMITVIESWINALARPESRGRFMSVYMISYYLAGTGGQLLVGLYAPTDFRGFSLAAGLLALSSVPLCLTSQPTPALPKGGRLAFGRLYAASPIAVIGALASGFAQSSFYQLAPVYVNRIGGSNSAVAHYMAFAVLASMMLQYPLGRMADRSDRTRVILGIGGGMGFSALTVCLAGPWSTALLIATTMVYSGLAASLYPACVARLNERTGGLDPVAANASLLLCYGIGQLAGPIVSSAAMGLAGPSGLYLSIAAAMAIFAVWVARRRQLGDLPAGQRYRIVPSAPEFLPVVSDDDPRVSMARDGDKPRDLRREYDDEHAPE